MKKTTIGLYIICILSLSVAAYYVYTKRNEITQYQIDDASNWINQGFQMKSISGKPIGGNSVEFNIYTNEISPVEIGTFGIERVADSCLAKISKINPKVKKEDSYFNFWSYDTLTSVTLKYKKNYHNNWYDYTFKDYVKSIADSVSNYSDSLTVSLGAVQPIKLSCKRKWYNVERTKICAIITMNIVLPNSVGNKGKEYAEKIGKDFCQKKLKDFSYYTYMEIHLFEDSTPEMIDEGLLFEPTQIIDFPTKKFM